MGDKILKTKSSKDIYQLITWANDVGLSKEDIITILTKSDDYIIIYFG